jgi:pimeloyl-ACP methyl ester carboxylesterase
VDEPWPSLAELASLRCPVRCYFGDRSPFRTSADVARAAFGSSAVRVLEGGHGLHVDAKVALGNELERFLSSEGAESASCSGGFDLAIGAGHG